MNATAPGPILGTIDQGPVSRNEDFTAENAQGEFGPMMSVLKEKKKFFLMLLTARGGQCSYRIHSKIRETEANG